MVVRDWLEPSSSSYIALKKIVTEKLYLSDLQYFRFKEMVARTQLVNSSLETNDEM